MIVSSFNIRGLGGTVKKLAIKDLIIKERVDFLALQETKLETISASVCFSI
jgi:exonuclease III